MINLDLIFSCVPKNKLNLKKSKIIKKNEIKKILNYTGYLNVNRLPDNVSSSNFIFSIILVE